MDEVLGHIANNSAERPSRGVRLGDLDRATGWVIGYTGRRWEVLGPTTGCPYCGCEVAGGPQAETAQR